MMNFLRRHWYNVGLIVALITAVILFFQWEELGILRTLILLNFIALLLHQFEEFGFPGGGPAIANMFSPVTQSLAAASGSDYKPIVDRYPLNQNNAMAGNMTFSYGMYLIPAFFPQVIWMGIAPAIFGLIQLIPHLFATNVKMKTGSAPSFL